MNEQPTVYLVIDTSAVAFEESHGAHPGEILETVEWTADNRPDWTNAGICDHRGEGGDPGYEALHLALTHAEENARLIGLQVRRVPRERPEAERLPEPEGVDAAEEAETEKAAREAGAEHGRAAGSWYFDFGRDSSSAPSPAEQAARVLRGIEEGDPEVMDTFPGPPLSGEWADSPTPASVLGELGVDPESDEAPDLLDVYENAYYDAVHETIEEHARWWAATEESA